MKVLVPLPRRDFDPSEAAVSWKVLRDAGHEIVFATPDGKLAHADPVRLGGIGLDFWSRVPGLRRVVLVGLPLRANRAARAAHRDMLADDAFRRPLRAGARTTS